ncbi:MAG: hypothetical protein DHS20C07_18930 [Methyloligella sp.]|nr:MAG: hypothetical protein DHS20C07_18930 [Methyloligella sp.]
MTIKLVYSNDDSPKALGMKIAKSNKSITNGAIAKYGDIVKADYQEGICGHIEWTATPLVTAAENISRIASRGLKVGTSYEDQAKALRAIREIMKDSFYEYINLLEIKRLDHEGE